ncbi:MAG: hypothetical protein ACREQV_09970, partial [Candidatus Binatia bacterium]
MLNYRSATPDLPPVSPKLDPKNLKVSLVNRQVADNYAQLDKQYQELFGKGKAQMMDGDSAKSDYATSDFAVQAVENVNACRSLGAHTSGYAPLTRATAGRPTGRPYI